MTRKKFIKQLMAVGVSRNTATAAADAASRAEITLLETAGRVRTMQRIFVGEMAPVKQWRKAFDQRLRTQAERTPRRIRPLAKKHRQDGLHIDWAAIDELHTCGGYILANEDQADTAVERWTKENPYLPVNIQAMTRADHAAIHGGGGHE